ALGRDGAGGGLREGALKVHGGDHVALRVALLDGARLVLVARAAGVVAPVGVEDLEEVLLALEPDAHVAVLEDDARLARRGLVRLEGWRERDEEQRKEDGDDARRGPHPDARRRGAS